MSSASDAQQLISGAYITVAASVLYLFESCMTLSQEYDAIWSRKRGVMAILYASTRYNSVLLSILNLFVPWNRTRRAVWPV
ncbi:hypothetical protein BC629DRAFT_1107004 [Irpex lacteus]|nr:hypothetical protein BC629DRAFT_1107004 [Irpex lacteus]